MARADRGAEADEEQGVDALFAGPPEEFVAERDALAKRLRSAGEREAAERVKALRRPTVPAAAINRAVRAEPDLAREVVEAGERLGAEQEAALAGDASELRGAMAAESEAVERLVDRIAGDAGLAPAMVDRARDTVRAGGRSAELRDDFLAGRLVRDAEAVGFGGELAQADPPRERRAKEAKRGRGGGAEASPKPAKPAGKGRAKTKARSESAPRSKPRRSGPTAAERRRAEQRVTRAEKALDAARSATDDAHEASSEAETQVTEAEETIAATEREISDARKRLRQAERELEKAQRRLDRAEAKATQAEDAQATRESELTRARAALPE